MTRATCSRALLKVKSDLVAARTTQCADAAELSEIQSFLRHRARGPNRCKCGVVIAGYSASCSATLCRKQVVESYQLEWPDPIEAAVEALRRYKTYAAAGRHLGLADTTVRGRVMQSNYYNRLLPRKARTRKVNQAQLAKTVAKHGIHGAARLLEIDRRTIQRRLRKVTDNLKKNDDGHTEQKTAGVAV